MLRFPRFQKILFLFHLHLLYSCVLKNINFIVLRPAWTDWGKLLHSVFTIGSFYILD